MPATEHDAMMPDLPEPYHTLVAELGWKAYRNGVADETGTLDEATDANHASYEAERALRLALLEVLHGKA